MPGTLVTGQRGTTTISSDQRRIDMADKILLLEPDANPLTQFTKRLSKKGTVNPQFKWQEDELDPRFDAVNNGAGYNTSATTIAVDNGAYFAAQDLVLNPRTGEVFRVTAVSTNDLTVVRGVGNSGTGVAMLDNDELLILASAQPEGDSSKTARTRNPSTVYNYTQIFRDPWDATQTALHSENEGGDDWDHQAKKKGIEHAKNIEYAFMLGKKDESTTSGQARRTTGGLDSFVSTNVTDAGGTFTETELFTGLRTMFRYGSREKLGLGSGLSIDVINAFARGKVEIQQSEKTFGIRLMQVVSPHGTLSIATHWLLEGTTLGGQLWVVDPECCTYRYLNNKRGSRDTHINREIQAPDVDGRKDEYLTEAGLEFGLEKRHGQFIGITG